MRRMLQSAAVAISLLGLGASTATAGTLPDGRSWEMVSPVDKNDADINGDGQVGGPAQSSSDGNAVAFASKTAFGDSQGSQGIDTYLARRTTSGWSTEPITPRADPRFISNLSYSAFTSDLSKGILTAADPPLAAGAGAGSPNLYLRDNLGGGFSLLSPNGPVGAIFAEPVFADATPDAGHVIFESSSALTPDALTDGSNQLYEWTGGQVRLVGILPDGTVGPGGAIAGATPANRINNAGYMTRTTISSDGSRIFFQTPPSDGVPPNLGGNPGGSLYVRENGTSTVEVSESKRSTPDPNGTKAATFWAAATDGSQVFFTSQEELTDDANTGINADGGDLYRYDVDADTLTDLTPDSADPSGAQVAGVIGTSDDGAYVYFVAMSRLDGAKGTDGQPNLYVRHGASPPQFLGTLDAGDANWWSQGFFSTPPPNRPVTPDGRHLLLTSTARLTGYDNAGHAEVYLFDGDSGDATCVSCDPSGASPGGDATTRPPNGGAFPTQTLGRAMTDDASLVFFQTPDPLVPEDTNGKQDVYEYESGKARLVSSGTGAFDSQVFDASADGRNVFVVTRNRLVGVDQDSYDDLYDARVGGGIPAQNPVPGRGQCSGSACQGDPTPPAALPIASSVTFVGVGNASPRPASAPKVHVTKPKVIAGTSGAVKVKVPGKGRLTAGGQGLKATARNVTKASTVTVKVVLTSRARATLNRKHVFRAKVRVAFTPSGGTSSTANVVLTFKAPSAKKSH